MTRQLALLTAFCLFLAAAPGCSVSGGDGRSPREVSARGDSNYRFTLMDTAGRPVSLDGLLKNHKAVLLNFWATWCPYCIEEMPALIQYQTRYADKSFTVVGIDAGEGAAEADAFAKKMGVNYPIILDQDLRVSETYGIVGLPTSLLILSDGTVVGEYHSITPKLEADIEKALQ